MRVNSSGLATADRDHPILIADSGCDQTLVTGILTIICHTGRSILMAGAFAGPHCSEMFPVVDAGIKITCPDGTEYFGIAREALCDNNPNQVESLLSNHQCLSNPTNSLDDRATCEKDVHGRPGTQSA